MASAQGRNPPLQAFLAQRELGRRDVALFLAGFCAFTCSRKIGRRGPPGRRLRNALPCAIFGQLFYRSSRLDAYAPYPQKYCIELFLLVGMAPYYRGAMSHFPNGHLSCRGQISYVLSGYARRKPVKESKRCTHAPPCHKRLPRLVLSTIMYFFRLETFNIPSVERRGRSRRRACLTTALIIIALGLIGFFAMTA